MIVKFARRGKGGGSGPVDYLLGKDRDRDGSRVLQGDPEAIREIIDSVQFKQRYKSGFLSFEEENIPESEKQKIMDSFQEALLPGLDPSQFAILWVEHLDKGRLELNFVIPTIELQTAKRLQPYYDSIDRQRVDDWKNITNHKFGLTDPNDPSKKRKLNIRGIPPLDVKNTKELITQIVGGLIDAEFITDRTTLLSELENGGFKIAKVAKDYISIENPNGARNIRLDGSYFEHDFRAGPEMAEEVARKTAEYRAGTGERISKIHKRYTSAIEHRAGKNRTQYRRNEPEPTQPDNRPTPQALANALTQPDPHNFVGDIIGDNHPRAGVSGLIHDSQGGRGERGRGLGEMPTAQRQSRLLHDTGQLDANSAREQIIAVVAGIGDRAGDRADANESAAGIDKQHAENLSAAAPEVGGAGRLLMYANRAVRAVSAAIEYVRQRIEPTPDTEPYSGPTGPSM
jgi:hypothetical protein